MGDGIFNFGKSKSKGKKRTYVPDYLKPFINQSVGTAGSALGSMSRLAGQDLVAGFDPFQELAMQMGADVAQGAGGYLPTAQNALMGAASGTDISSFIPSYGALSGLSGGGTGYIPQSALSTLNAGTMGGFVPGSVSDMLGGAMQNSGVPGAAYNTLSGLAQGSSVPGVATDALTAGTQAGPLLGQGLFDRNRENAGNQPNSNLPCAILDFAYR